MPGDFLHRTAQMVSCGVLTHNLRPSQFLEPVGQSLPATSINGSIRWLNGKRYKGVAHGYVNIKSDRPSDIWIVMLPVKELNAAAQRWLHISKKPVVSVCHCPSWGQRHRLATRKSWCSRCPRCQHQLHYLKGSLKNEQTCGAPDSKFISRWWPQSIQPSTRAF